MKWLIGGILLCLVALLTAYSTDKDEVYYDTTAGRTRRTHDMFWIRWSESQTDGKFYQEHVGPLPQPEWHWINGRYGFGSTAFAHWPIERSLCEEGEFMINRLTAFTAPPAVIKDVLTTFYSLSRGGEIDKRRAVKYATSITEHVDKQLKDTTRIDIEKLWIGMPEPPKEP